MKFPRFYQLIISIVALVGLCLIVVVRLQLSHHEPEKAKSLFLDRSHEKYNNNLRGIDIITGNESYPEVLGSDSDSIESPNTIIDNETNSSSIYLYTEALNTTISLLAVSGINNLSLFEPTLSPTLSPSYFWSNISSPITNVSVSSSPTVLPTLMLSVIKNNTSFSSNITSDDNFVTNISVISRFQPNSYFNLVRMFHKNINQLYALKSTSIAPSKISTVELLFRAIRNGSTCIPYIPSSTADDFAIISTIQAAVNEFHPKLFIEYTSSPKFQSISRFIAERNPKLTNLLFSFSNLKSVDDEFCEGDNFANLLSVKNHQVEFQKQSSFNCVQFIQSLEILSYDLLPFEFEGQLGSIICKCNTTYIPKQLPNTPFFSAWDSIDMLIHNSLEAMEDNSCQVDFGSAFSNLLQPLRYSHLLLMVNTSVSSSTYSASISLEDLQLLNLDADSKSLVAFELISFHEREFSGNNNNDFDSSIQWIGSQFVNLKSMIKYYGANTLWSNDKIIKRAQLPRLATSYYSDKRRRQISHDHLMLNNHSFVASQLDTEMSNTAHDVVLDVVKDILTSDIHFETKRNSFYLNPESRNLQKQLYQFEKDSYLLWSDIILNWVDNEGIRIFDQFQFSNSIYLFGRSFGLLSLKLAKLARTQPNKLIISMAHSNQSANTIHKLSQLMNLKNIIITVPKWSIEVLTALLASPDRADLVMLQSDMLLRIINIVATSDFVEDKKGDVSQSSCQDLSARILELYSVLVSTGRVTYVQLPPFSLISDIVHFLFPKCANELKKTIFLNETIFLSEVCNQITFDYNIDIYKMTAVDGRPKQNAYASIFRISFSPFQDSTTLAEPFQQKHTKLGISIYTACWLNMVAAQKQLTLTLLINLPLWKIRFSTFTSLEEYASQLAPWDLYLQPAANMLSNDISWKIVYHGEEFDLNILDSKALDKVQIDNSVVDNNAEFNIGMALFEAVSIEFQQHNSELANGKFSFIEHDSGMGYLSTRLAMKYPNATIFALEREQSLSTLHEKISQRLEILNNPICLKDTADSAIFKNLYESPELFRFQLLFRNVLNTFQNSHNLASWGRDIGMILSSALTSFVYVPNKALVSWAMFLLFGEIYLPCNGGLDIGSINLHIGPYRYFSHILGWNATTVEDDRASKLFELNTLSAHPQLPYSSFDSEWLLSFARASRGTTSLLISPISFNSMATKSRNTVLSGVYLDFPIVRCDIVNMSRHVHHHYDYARDGHSRTYTMQITLNSTLTESVMQTIGDPSSVSSFVDTDGVHLRLLDQYSNSVENITLPLGHHPLQRQIVYIRLARDKDSFPIPYVSVYGVTLITALRLGLLPSLRDRLFHEFLRLPLYEDMAPWNIVLMGQVNIL